MRSERKKKIMTLTILFIAVLMTSIGFAAFSSTLRIKTATTVNPNSSDFKVVLSSNENKLETNPVKANPENMGSDGIIDNTVTPTISGLVANFSSPGDSATYTFYVRNEGEYEAFLNSITFGKKTCTPGDGADENMVYDACGFIATTISVGNITTDKTMADITGESLKPDESKPVTVTILYDANGARVDGPFTIEFSEISMYYNAVSGINEEIETESICYLSNDLNGNKIIDLSDEIICGQDTFIIIPNDPEAHPTAIENNITLLRKNALPTNPVNFAETKYWESSGFVYDERSLIYPYVEEYKTSLKQLGVDVKEASIPSANQYRIYRGYSNTGANFSFYCWLGTSLGQNLIYDTGRDSGGDQPYDNYGLIRPIIVISKFDITRY